MIRLTWRERLFGKCTPDENGCWIWNGAKLAGGYGSFTGPGPNGGRTLSTAHRWAYIAAHGDVAEGMHIDHLCNVPSCINPTHLEQVTPQENIRRRDARRGFDTHCRSGHLRTPENTYVYAYGNKCKDCVRVRNQSRGRKQVSA